MKTRIIFATGNENKLREIREILSDLPVEIVSQREAGISTDVDENGTTFAENAFIKARAVYDKAHEMTMADDSGLVIDALNGKPGVHSARWMGHDTSYHIKNQKILELMKDVPKEKRTARFVCSIACILPDGRELSCTENFEGAIGYEEKGGNGFGYDPIFYLPDKGVYSAELTDDEKNAISHRGKALRKMRDMLKKELPEA